MSKLREKQQANLSDDRCELGGKFPVVRTHIASGFVKAVVWTERFVSCTYRAVSFAPPSWLTPDKHHRNRLEGQYENYKAKK